MALIHRNDDARTCGATTIASQSKLTFAGEAAALEGDIETHGAGQFNPSGRKVTFQGKTLICIGDSAVTDSLLHPNPAAASGFAKASIS